MTIDIKTELNDLGENFSKMIINLAEDVIYKLKEEPNFTGKIIYTINCKNGGRQMRASQCQIMSL